MKIKFAGNEMNLVGTQVKVGDKVKDVVLLNNGLEEVSILDFEGVKVISVVPSLDTGVCDIQTRTFNSELPEGVTVLTVSNDLPFAQARWCGASGLDNVITLSDYRDNNFGEAFGTLVKELKLQTRAVFVVDSNNNVVYTEFLEEITNHPDYDKVKEAVNSL